MLSAPRCCHSVDQERAEAPGSVGESRCHERVTQQPDQQKSRQVVSVAAAAQSSPIHRTLGQVRTKGLLANWILYIYHLAAAACVINSSFLEELSALFFWAPTGCF